MPENDAYYYFHMLDKYFKKYNSSIELEVETHWWRADDLYIKIGEERIPIGKIKNRGIIWTLGKEKLKESINRVKGIIDKINNEIEPKIENIFNNTERILNGITQEEFDILMSHPKFRDKLEGDKNKTMIIQKQKERVNIDNNDGINTADNNKTEFQYNLFFVNGEDGDDILNNNLQLNNNTNLYNYIHGNGGFKSFDFLNHLNWKQLDHNNSECIFIVPNNEAHWGFKPFDFTIKNNAKRTATIIQKILDKDNDRENNRDNNIKLHNIDNNVINNNINTNSTNEPKIKKLNIESFCYGNMFSVELVNYLTKAIDKENMKTKSKTKREYYENNLKALKDRKIILDVSTLGFNKLGLSYTADKFKRNMCKILKNNTEEQVKVSFKNTVKDNEGGCCGATHNSEFNIGLMKSVNEKVEKDAKGNNNFVKIGGGREYFKDGDKYKGEREYDNGRMVGTYKYGNGDYYIGNLIKDYKFDGYGVLYSKDNRYEGFYNNDERDCIGIIYDDYDEYFGCFSTLKVTINNFTIIVNNDNEDSYIIKRVLINKNTYPIIVYPSDKEIVKYFNNIENTLNEKIQQLQQKDNIKNDLKAQQFIDKLKKIIENIEKQNNIKTKKTVSKRSIII